MNSAEGTTGADLRLRALPGNYRNLFKEASSFRLQASGNYKTGFPEA